MAESGSNGISLGTDETVVQGQVGPTLLPDKMLHCTQIHVWVQHLQTSTSRVTTRKLSRLGIWCS